MILVAIGAVIAYQIFGKLAVSKGYKKSKWGGKGAGVFAAVTFGCQLLFGFLAGMMDSSIAENAGALLVISLLSYIPGVIAAVIMYNRYKNEPAANVDDFGTFGKKDQESDFE